MSINSSAMLSFVGVLVVVPVSICRKLVSPRTQVILFGTDPDEVDDVDVGPVDEEEAVLVAVFCWDLAFCDSSTVDDKVEACMVSLEGSSSTAPRVDASPLVFTVSLLAVSVLAVDTSPPVLPFRDLDVVTLSVGLCPPSNRS